MTGRPVNAGKIGVRTTVTKNKVPSTVENTEENVQIDLPVGVPLASVGISISAGMNTDFGREKIEASAWCTLPCLPDKKNMELTYDTCYAYASEKAKSSLDRAARDFFPHLYKEGP